MSAPQTMRILAEQYSSVRAATPTFDKFYRACPTTVCLHSNKELTGCYQAAVPNVC